MRRKVLGTVLALLVGLPAAGWAVEFPVVVADVQIEGTEEIRDRDVLEVIDFQAGDEISQADLRAASQAVFDLGWFSEVMPDVAEDGTVMFRVVENPTIDRIEIRGNVNRQDYSLLGIKLFDVSIMPTSVIKRTLRQNGVRKGVVLNRGELETALEEIIHEYNERGYVLVAIGDVKIAETLEIEIVEAHVSESKISGLRTVPREVAEDMIDLPLGEPLKKVDVQRVLSRLRQSVYFTNVEVVPQPGAEPTAVVLEWSFEEREFLEEPKRIVGIELQGVTQFPEDLVYEQIGDLPDGVVDNYDLLRAVSGVYHLYTEAGFMMARLVKEGVDDEEVLLLRVDEGRIAGIELEGNEHTKAYVIRRKLGLAEGEVLTRADYLVTYQTLMALGYFSSVDLLPEWQDGGVQVLVRVAEKANLGGLQGSLSLDPATGGIVGELSLQQKNLMGTGQDIELSYSRGLTEGGEPANSTWNLGYSSVAFFQGFDRVGFDVYRRKREVVTTEDTFSVVTLGGGVSFSHPLGDYTDLDLGFRHEEERVSFSSAWIPTDSLTVSLVYDDIAEPWFPTQGERRVLSLEKAGGFSRSREYTSLDLLWIHFEPGTLPFFGSLEQAVGIRTRMTWGDARLPPSKYAELGGPKSVRGADATSIPRLGLINAEYRVELVEESLTLTGFFDAGVNLDSVSPETAVSSTGLELGVAAAGMFLRLDIAWLLGPEWDWMPHFQFGFSRMF